MKKIVALLMALAMLAIAVPGLAEMKEFTYVVPSTVENLEHSPFHIAQKLLAAPELAPVLHLDMELPPQYATLALLKEWEMLEPLGTGNERPLFAARNMTFVRGRLLGEKSNVGRYTVRDPKGRSYELMLFSGLDRWHAFLERRFGASERQRLYAQGEGTSIRLSIAYYPSINEYRGQESVRLVMEDYQ